MGHKGREGEPSRFSFSPRLWPGCSVRMLRQVALSEDCRDFGDLKTSLAVMLILLQHVIKSNDMRQSVISIAIVFCMCVPVHQMHAGITSRLFFRLARTRSYCTHPALQPSSTRALHKFGGKLNKTSGLREQTKPSILF